MPESGTAIDQDSTMHLISDLLQQPNEYIEKQQIKPWLSKLPHHISLDIQEKMMSESYKLTLERVLNLL
jgi:hypothetical protein